MMAAGKTIAVAQAKADVLTPPDPETRRIKPPLAKKPRAAKVRPTQAVADADVQAAVRAAGVVAEATEATVAKMAINKPRATPVADAEVAKMAVMVSPVVDAEAVVAVAVAVGKTLPQPQKGRE